MKHLKLPEDYRLVLKQISDMGEEDFAALAESVRLSRARLAHIVQSLQHKGLLLVSRSGYGDAWIRLSSKGRRISQFMWPEASFAA